MISAKYQMTRAEAALQRAACNGNHEDTVGACPPYGRRSGAGLGLSSMLALMLASWSIASDATAQPATAQPTGGDAAAPPVAERTDKPPTEGASPQEAGGPSAKGSAPGAAGAAGTGDKAPQAATAPAGAEPTTAPAGAEPTTAPAEAEPTTEAPPSATGQPKDATLQTDGELPRTVVFAGSEPAAGQRSTATAPAPAPASSAEAAERQADRQPPSVAGTATAADVGPAKQKECWMRDGFYLRASGGVGFTGLAGDGPSGSASVGGLGEVSTVAIGGSIAPRLVLAFLLQAAEASSKFKGGPYTDATLSVDGDEIDASNKASATASLLGALLDWYPMETSGLHLGIGLGLGFVGLVNEADDSELYGLSGAATLLVGYDMPIAYTWALGIALVAAGSTTASLKESESGDDADYDLTPFSVGLSASILYF